MCMGGHFKRREPFTGTGRRLGGGSPGTPSAARGKAAAAALARAAQREKAALEAALRLAAFKAQRLTSLAPMAPQQFFTGTGHRPGSGSSSAGAGPPTPPNGSDSGARVLRFRGASPP